MSTVEEIELAIQKLPSQEVEKLAHWWDDFRSENLDAEWKNEIQRRVKGIENGTATLIEHDDAMAQVRAALSKADSTSTHT